jgi:hypothetical protein
MSKRKKIIINPKFQFKFSLNLLLPMLIVTSVFWLTVEFFFYRMVKFGKVNNLPDGHAYFTLINLQRKEFIFILLVLALVLAIVFFIWGLLYSHRIAGPLYKLNKHFVESKDLDEVKNKPLSFRPNDYFSELPVSINSFFDRLKDK